MITFQTGFITNSSTEALVIIFPKENHQCIKALLENVDTIDWKTKLDNSVVAKKLKHIGHSYYDHLKENIQSIVKDVATKLSSKLDDQSNVLIDIEVDVDGCAYESPESNYYTFVALELLTQMLSEYVYTTMEYR